MDYRRDRIILEKSILYSLKQIIKEDTGLSHTLQVIFPANQHLLDLKYRLSIKIL